MLEGVALERTRFFVVRGPRPEGAVALTLLAAWGCEPDPTAAHRTSTAPDAAHTPLYDGTFDVLGEYCVYCLRQACEARLATCSGYEPCGAQFRCWTPTKHWSECSATAPAGTAAAELIRECARDSCPDWCSVGEHWRCSGLFEWQSPESSSAEVGVRWTSAENGAPLAGLSTRVCRTTDADCADPVATTTTDAQGWSRFELPLNAAGWVGFVRADGPGLFPELRTNTMPLVEASSLTFVAPSTEMVTSILADAGASLDPARGHVIVDARDCAGATAQAAVISVAAADSQSRTFHEVDGRFDFDADRTQRGIAGVVNVPPGDTLVSVVSQDGALLASSNVPVLAGIATYATLHPRTR